MAMTCVCMVIVLWAGLHLTAENFIETGPQHLRIMSLLGMIGAGCITYFAVSHVSGAMRFGELRAMFRRERPTLGSK